MKKAKMKSSNTKRQLLLADRIKTISWKFRNVSESYPELNNSKDKSITSPSSFYKTFNFLFEYEVKEKFVVFWLSNANKVIGYEVISEGLLNETVVASREVFRGVIVSSCANIIVAHNHPSGNPKPSDDDINMTHELIQAGKILNIKVSDHIVFCNDSYYSFLEHRLCGFRF